VCVRLNDQKCVNVCMHVFVWVWVHVVKSECMFACECEELNVYVCVQKRELYSYV